MNLNQLHAYSIIYTQRSLMDIESSRPIVFMPKEKEMIILNSKIDDKEDENAIFNMYSAFLQAEGIEMYSLSSAIRYYMSATDPDNELHDSNVDKKTGVIICTRNKEDIITNIFDAKNLKSIPELTCFGEDVYQDNINLFERLKPLPEKHLEYLRTVDKPHWYHTFPMTEFMKMVAVTE